MTRVSGVGLLAVSEILNHPVVAAGWFWPIPVLPDPAYGQQSFRPRTADADGRCQDQRRDRGRDRRIDDLHAGRDEHRPGRVASACPASAGTAESVERWVLGTIDHAQRPSPIPEIQFTVASFAFTYS